MAQIPVDPFNSNMDDLFNQLMGNMGGLNSERRYLINGREVTPEEYAQFRQTGQLPGTPAACHRLCHTGIYPGNIIRSGAAGERGDIWLILR